MVLALPFFACNINAQIKFGLKAGVNTYQIEETLHFTSSDSPSDHFKYTVENTNVGYHIGLYGQINAGLFIIQPEVLFNSDNVDFRLTDANDPSIINEVVNQSYQNIDIPILIKFKVGPARLMVGPVGHLFVSNNTNFIDAVFEEPIEDQFEFGFQTGIGLSFWKLHIDLKYEGNFNKFGNQINIYGTELAFSKNNNRLILSAGYEF